MKKMKTLLAAMLLIALAFFAEAQQKKQATKAAPAGPTGKPNIVIIWGDDIGQTNISAYSHGRDGLQDTQH